MAVLTGFLIEKGVRADKVSDIVSRIIKDEENLLGSLQLMSLLLGMVQAYDPPQGIRSTVDRVIDMWDFEKITGEEENS